MSDFLEAAKHHKALHEDLKFIDVPELQKDGKPLRIFYRPFLSVWQKEQVMADMGPNLTVSYKAMLTALMVRALKEDGTRLIPDIERKEVEQALSSSVLDRIIAKMGGILEQVDPKP